MRAYQSCLDNNACDPSQFLNKEVIWEGSYDGTYQSTTQAGVVYQLTKMPTAKMRSRDGFDVVVADDLLHRPSDVSNWERLVKGARVRFRATISLTAFLSANSSNTCCFFVILKDGSTLVIEPSGPAISSVTEGAGNQPVIAPHGWVVIKGTDLASASRTWEQRDFNGQALPVNLEGTRVTINGKPAYIYYVSPTQLNVLAPADTAEGPVTVEVTTPRGTGRATVRMDRYAPGLFLQDPENRKYVAALHAGGGVVGRTGLYPTLPNNTRPLLAGGRAQLYGSGWGRTDRPQPEGVLFAGAYSIVGIEHLRVYVGGQPAAVEFAGATAPGLYQINIVAPPSLPSGDHLVEVQFGNYRTQPNVYITIQGTGPTSQLSAVPGSLSFSHRTGQPPPAPASLQLTSSSGSLDFSASVSGSPTPTWLTLSAPSGRTPANLSVSVNPSGLAAGVYSASIRIAAAGANTVNVPVTLTVTTPPAATPIIDKLSPDNGFPNELLPSFTVTGTGLEQVTGIVVEPSAGIVINSVKATATKVTAQLLVAGNAPVNSRMLYVVTPGGRSNALPFNVLIPSIVPSIFNLTLDSHESGPGASTSFQFDFIDGDRDILYKGGFGQSAQIEVDFSESQFIYNGCEDIYTGPPLHQPGQARGSISLTALYSHSTKISSTGGIPLLIRLRDSAGNRSAPVRVRVNEYYSVCQALGVRRFSLGDAGDDIAPNSQMFRESDGAVGRLAGEGLASEQLIRPQE